jgi:protein-tyrosine sulfotransferase
MSVANESGGPIFILSCARSGSTLLRYIIDTHPMICSPAELNLGALCKTLYVAVYNTIAQVSGAKDEEEKKCIAHAEVRQRVAEIMGAYAQAKDKSRWCEKSPMNLKHVDILQNVFPNANYICLYRHCLDVVHSCLEFSRMGFVDGLFTYVKAHPQNLVAAMVNYWVDCTDELMMFEERNPKQCFRIKYESVLLNPGETLESMFSFLGVGWEQDLVNKTFSISHDEGAGDRKILFYKGLEERAMGKGVAIPRNLIPNDLTEKMNRLLVKLDYPVVGSDLDSWPTHHATKFNETGDAQEVASIEEIFTRHIPERLKARAEAIKDLKALYRISVNSENSATWMIDLTGSEVRILRQNAPADCTIIVSEPDLISIVNGRLNAAAAFSQGKLYVTERLDLARKLGKVILGA